MTLERLRFVFSFAFQKMESDSGYSSALILRKNQDLFFEKRQLELILAKDKAKKNKSVNSRPNF